MDWGGGWSMGVPVESRMMVSYATADAMADGLEVCWRADSARWKDVSFRGVAMVCGVVWYCVLVKDELDWDFMCSALVQMQHSADSDMSNVKPNFCRNNQ